MGPGSDADSAGRLATLDDGKGVFTYTWDGTDAAGKTERRGMITKLDVGLPSGPDVFSAAADVAGNRTKVVYPNGVTRTSGYFASGAGYTRLDHNAAGADLLGWTMYRDVDSRIRQDIFRASRKPLVASKVHRTSGARPWAQQRRLLRIWRHIRLGRTELVQSAAASQLS